jgi:hypothetical protein
MGIEIFTNNLYINIMTLELNTMGIWELDLSQVISKCGPVELSYFLLIKMFMRFYYPISRILFIFIIK